MASDFITLSFPSPDYFSLGVFFFFFFWLPCVARGDLSFPIRDQNPCPLHWEHRVLTTGAPKSPLGAYF